MDFRARRTGYTQISDDDRMVLSRQQLVGADFSGRHLTQFSAEGSRFEQCRFDRTVIESGSFGAGRSVSEYVGCSFDGARIRMGPGGYARFIDCSFDKANIEHWVCFAVELVGCTFSGRLDKVVFNGTPRPEDVDVTGSPVNRFEGNDFARAKLVDVGFRTGIDLAKQRLPTGDEYTLLEDAKTAVRRARIALNAWEDPESKKRARGVLAVMEQDASAGQSQLLIRVDDYPRPARPAVQALLDAAQAG
ncbi:hypothetical protein [Nocardioides sp.]|uniref:hypothetical protein n=1 Tax=Nocardioides sp. TaxID=35761 RepID=UPI0019B74EF8|nr:hypothetical protein [Nocardioides sp.]MBC7274913.1 hypothetical protein [Nocardioides sp.]